MKRTPIKRKPCKVKPLDDLFSKYVRLMSGGYCKRCWLMGSSNAYKGYGYLQTAHCVNREIHATRWEYDNVAPLCAGCHFHLDNNHEKKHEFFIEILGKKRYDEIIAQGKPGGKPDRERIKATLKERIKLLEDD